MAKLAREAGFTGVKIIPTSGKPGVFGRLDAGARTTLGVYFMYDVKQFVPEEWSSPPLEARLVEKPGLGTVVHGPRRRQPEGAGELRSSSALMAFKAAGRKLPVNLVLVCEGEEEIGSPHFGEVVQTARRCCRTLKKCAGRLHARGGAGPGRQRARSKLGAKGVVELELVSSGEKWGRGPTKDIHSSLEAQVDSPDVAPGAGAQHARREGRPHARGRGLLREGAAAVRRAEARWSIDYAANGARGDDQGPVRRRALGHGRETGRRRCCGSYSQPTINIEGLVGGYTGPGGKTVLPHRAVAKIDMRLVPDMTAADTLAEAQGAPGQARLRRHRGQHDRRLRPDPDRPGQPALIQAELATYRKLGVEPLAVAALGRLVAGLRFTDAPLSLPAGHFGLGHGTGAHAPDEYFLIESTNPKVQGLDGAVASFVEFLYALA